MFSPGFTLRKFRIHHTGVSIWIGPRLKRFNGNTRTRGAKKRRGQGPLLFRNGEAYFFFAALAAGFAALAFAPLAALEALKLRDLEAAILMGAPVWGLRPVRALRLF